MIKHILSIIWNQRRSNSWIFAELLVVAGVFWLMVDMFYVDTRTYYSPLGFDITNVWRFKLSEQERNPSDSLPGLSEPEKLTRLMSQIRQWSEVEEVCATYYSCPYSMGNSWREIEPLDGDTSLTSGENFQIRNVTPEYFKLFRIKTPEGKPVADEIAGIHNALVLSKEMADVFYHGRLARGRKVRHSKLDNTFTVAFVSTSIRADNLFVYGISNIREFRDIHLDGKGREMSNKFSLMAFMLVNVFFGIIGTFWLRAQNRRGEIGLRMALGAYDGTLRRYLYLEGLCLLALTLPFITLFAINMVATDAIDTYRLPFTTGRFAISFGITYLMMSGMICLGIWLPVRKVTRMVPAEALHYE